MHAAPEEDTVTKDEMNPITGRKDILHLVHPGGTPRSRTKKAPGRPTSQPIGVPAAAAAAVEPDAPEPSPSKDSSAWAIPAPNGTEAIGAGMFESVRDSSSPEDSPQFVIAANAAPSAWPALSELATNTDAHERAALGVGRRPSTKDVVAGTASASDNTTKEVAQGARMLPLAAPGLGGRFGIRGMVNGSAPLLSSSSRELQEDEHALSTMPSTELLGSRARLDLCADSPDDSPTAPPHSPSAMMPAVPDCTSASSALSEAFRPVAEGSIQADGQTSALTAGSEVGQLAALKTSGVAQTAPRISDAAGERMLSALDLLPASLEDALDGRASLPSTAQVEESHSPPKPSSYPQTPNPGGASNNNNLSSVMHPSGRKQSRFAFVNEGTVCTSGATSFSLPKDLDNLTDAPAFKPGGARMGSSMQLDSVDMNSHASANTIAHGWDHSAAEEHSHAVKQFSLPLDSATLSVQSMLQQQQARLNPAVPSGLEQPPMTHESVVQAVSAQLQQIMSQGGQSSVSAAASRMMPAAGTASGHAGMGAGTGSLPSGWSPMHQKAAAPELAQQDPMHNTGIQFLQALLQQQQQELAAAGIHEASRGMQHQAGTVPASQAAARQGLAIKRPPQPPKPMTSMGGSVPASMGQHHGVQNRNFMPQHSGPPMHESLRPAAGGGLSHALHQGGAASLAMQRGMQYGHAPASVRMVDPVMQRTRALHHHMSQFGGGEASYLSDAAACGYGNWDAVHDSYNTLLNGPQMHARQMSAPLSNWHPRGHGWE